MHAAYEYLLPTCRVNDRQRKCAFPSVRVDDLGAPGRRVASRDGGVHVPAHLQSVPQLIGMPERLDQTRCASTLETPPTCGWRKAR